MQTTASVSTFPISGFHCGCSFQLHDLCPQSHTIGCKVTVRRCCCSQKISGENYRQPCQPPHHTPTRIAFIQHKNLLVFSFLVIVNFFNFLLTKNVHTLYEVHQTKVDLETASAVCQWYCRFYHSRSQSKGLLPLMLKSHLHILICSTYYIPIHVKSCILVRNGFKEPPRVQWASVSTRLSNVFTRLPISLYVAQPQVCWTTCKHFFALK